MIRTRRRSRVREGIGRLLRPLRVAPALAALALVAVLIPGATPARADPPIRSAEDAACRLEARARVFTTPNPRGLEPEVLGRQIYYACMRRLAPPEARPRRRARRARHGR